MISPLHVLDVVLGLVGLIPAWLAFRAYRKGEQGLQFFLGSIAGIIVSIVISLVYGWLIGL